MCHSGVDEKRVMARAAQRGDDIFLGEGVIELDRENVRFAWCLWGGVAVVVVVNVFDVAVDIVVIVDAVAAVAVAVAPNIFSCLSLLLLRALLLLRCCHAVVAAVWGRWCLQDFGLTLDEEQSKILFDKYDRDASGLVE